MKKVIVLLFLLTSVGLVYGQTIEELRDSMAAGNLNMQVELGVRYIEGDGVEQDCQEGLRLIRDAVDKGNRYGELRLGVCYDYGICVEENKETAFQWFVKSAEKGNLPAMHYVALAYEYGEGVEQNIQEAYRYYQKSADGGYPPAMVKIGERYLYGMGVEQDLEKAFELTKKAANDYYNFALLKLATFYFNGWGTKVDKSEALRIMNQVRETADEESPYKENADRFAAAPSKVENKGLRFKFNKGASGTDYISQVELRNIDQAGDGTIVLKPNSTVTIDIFIADYDHATALYEELYDDLCSVEGKGSIDPDNSGNYDDRTDNAWSANIIYQRIEVSEDDPHNAVGITDGVTHYYYSPTYTLAMFKDGDSYKIKIMYPLV